MSELEKFFKTYPDIKYPVWKVGDRFFLNSHEKTAKAFARKTGQVVEMVEKPAKATKGKGGDKITTEDGTQ